jgi:hypothetical protein
MLSKAYAGVALQARGDFAFFAPDAMLKGSVARPIVGQVMQGEWWNRSNLRLE